MRYGQRVVERELRRLGVEVEGSGDWRSALCPLHIDDSPSFAVHIDEGAWVCRAGCGKSNDLAELVTLITGDDVALIRDRLRRGEGEGTVDAVERALDRGRDLADPPAPKDTPPLFYETSRCPRYMYDRGFTQETLKRWHVGNDTEREAAVIPVWFDSRLRGLIYRRIVGKPKYENTPFEKSEILFGWDLLPVGPCEPVVVEGPLDAMWLDQSGIPAVATLGSAMSDHQAELLRQRCWGVILAFDADFAGEKATGEALRKLAALKVAVGTYPNGKNDAQDCTHEELWEMVDSASVLGGLLAR